MKTNYKFINLTPETIVYRNPYNGECISFPPSGKVIHIKYYKKTKETDIIHNIVIERFERSIDQHYVIETEIDELPGLEPQTFFIVSPEVFYELRKRHIKRYDIIAPAIDQTIYTVFFKPNGTIDAITVFLGLP